MEKRHRPNKDGGGGGRRRSPKRKKTTPTPTPLTHLPPADPNTIFSLLLAASLSGNSLHLPMLTNCLKKLHFLVLSEPLSDNLLLPLLALIPSLLLHSRDPRVACRGAEIVGAMSLQSLEMNERIVVDGETVRALVSLLGSSARRVSMAACNSLLDLCATSVGRRRLLECFALERLLYQLLQVTSSSTSVSLLSKDKADVSHVRIALKQDPYFVSIIYGAVILINTCNIQQLEKIPRKLSEPFTFFFKSMWVKVHEQVYVGKTLKSCRGTDSHLSNIHVNELAECLFRLSINVRDFATVAITTIKRRIFKDESTYETFMLSYWEAFPYHLRGPPDYDIKGDDLFSPFEQNLNCQKPSTFLRSMLGSFTSCPPMASNELDISGFLEEVRMELGSPIIYQQDIRVVRTEMQSKRELHYFDVSSHPSGLSTHCFTMSDIMKCEEAFKKGYTIALRGMEFRLLSITSITDALASLFGQPSAGANLYLTPPNTQGLARHSDDHCVFVFQLVGTKRWKIYPQLNFQLPCLYDSLSSQCASDVESSSVETMELLLKAGDMLYIPRGMAHEACGGADATFSLHLTFSIELEPAFQWEGFAHVALHCWNQMQSRPQRASVESLSGCLDIMSVNLLHASIEHIGDSDTTFRKACLAGALTLPLDSQSRLNLNQKATFEHVISKIEATTSFPDVLRKLEGDIQEHRDPFQRMRWLQHLRTDEETVEENDWRTPFRGFQRLLPVYVQHKDRAEAGFTELKSKFCTEVLFENVIDQYKRVLEMYRKTRMHYANGMLSLHCQ